VLIYPKSNIASCTSPYRNWIKHQPEDPQTYTIRRHRNTQWQL
jgi:hypothetical protein